MTGSPSRLSDPIEARESLVIRACISFLIPSTTSTSDPAKSTVVTLPISTPATRTTAPVFSPCTSGKRVFSVYCCQKKPAWPPTANTKTTASAIAMTAIIPIFSSDQASDRVRGICQSSWALIEERMDVRVLGRRRAQLVGVALEGDAAVAQHDELGLVRLVNVGARELELLAVAHRGVLGDEEGV